MNLKEFEIKARATSHFFSPGHPNPYHLEDDVWTHTQMVVEEARKIDPNNEILYFSALLHDTGKVYTRTPVPSKQRVHFHGHEGVSFYASLDVLKSLNASRHIAQKVATLVSLHGIVYQNKEKFLNLKNIQEFVNTYSFSEEKEDYLNLLKLIYADVKGRIASDQIKQENQQILKKIDQFLSEDFVVPSGTIEDKPNAYLLIGVQNSGKSTYIENELKTVADVNVLSRDEILMNLCHRINRHRLKTYNDCFEYLTRTGRQKEVDQWLNETFKQYKKEDKPIVIDMMNLTPKRRRFFINQLKKKFNVIAVVFFTPFSEIFERNRQREGKHIPEEVILDAMKRFSYPFMSEGIGKIINF